MEKYNIESIRKYILIMLTDKGSGHLGGALGSADLLTHVIPTYIDYDLSWFEKSFDKQFDPTQLRNQRSKFILSNGHVCPALYAIWAEIGLFDMYIESFQSTKIFQESLAKVTTTWSEHLEIVGKDWFDKNILRITYLSTLREVGSDLEGHPSLIHMPFLVDASTGPLGQGAGVGVGYAYADKLDNTNHKTFVSVGDGECQEGQIWEAAMIAARLGLDNLVWIVDRNYIQIDGDTEEVGGLDNSLIENDEMSGLANKFKAFGWLVRENKDGNNIIKIKDSLDNLLQNQTKSKRPAVLINHTKVGYPFDLFGTYHWHGKTPTMDETFEVMKLMVKKI
jgi:transketolase